METEHLLKPILKQLHKEKIRGVSVFRAIDGFGSSGTHPASLVDLSLNLPLGIEFFDKPEIVSKLLEDISLLVKPEHIVFWSAQANDKS